MFNAIRKLIRRLLIAVTILFVVAIVGILLAAPKLLTNIGGIALVLGAGWFILLGFCDSLNRGGGVGPTDEELRRRYHRHPF